MSAKTDIGPDMSLSYELTRDDYLDSQIAYNRDSDAVRRNVRRTRTGLASFYVFVILVLFPALEGGWRIAVVAGLVALAVAHIATVRELNELRVRRLARKMLDAAGDDRLVGRKKLKVEEDTLVFGGKSGSLRVPAASVVRILESPSNYHIFATDTAAIILPKSVEGDEDGPRCIVDFVRAKMAEASEGESPESSGNDADIGK